MPKLIGFLCYTKSVTLLKLGKKCFSLTQSEGSGLLYREHAPSTLTGKVNQLEVILRQLQTDLRKVRDREHHGCSPVFVVVFLHRDHQGLERTTSGKLDSRAQWLLRTLRFRRAHGKGYERKFTQGWVVYSRTTVLQIVTPQKKGNTSSSFMVLWIQQRIGIWTGHHC